MSDLTTFLRWLVEYALSGGFIHFCGVYLMVLAITRITTLLRISVRRKAKKQDRANG